MTVVAGAADAALAGWEGETGGIRVRTLAGPEPDADVVIGLRRPPDPGPGRRVWWPDGDPGPATGAAPLTIAPAGAGLWRRMVWPAADALFDLPEPPAPRVVLVGAEGDARCAALADELAARGHAVEHRTRLAREVIVEAGIVVVVADGAPPAPLHAVAAAGRLLVTVGVSCAFGLQPGHDHLAFDDAHVAAGAILVATREWDALSAMRRLGRLGAGRHRASVVFPALGRDLALGLGDAPAPPTGA